LRRVGGALQTAGMSGRWHEPRVDGGLAAARLRHKRPGKGSGFRDRIKTIDGSGKIMTLFYLKILKSKEFFF
jgi:hypothetical protein